MRRVGERNRQKLRSTTNHRPRYVPDWSKVRPRYVSQGGVQVRHMENEDRGPKTKTTVSDLESSLGSEVGGHTLDLYRP